MNSVLCCNSLERVCRYRPKRAVVTDSQLSLQIPTDAIKLILCPTYTFNDGDWAESNITCLEEATRNRENQDRTRAAQAVRSPPPQRRHHTPHVPPFGHLYSFASFLCLFLSVRSPSSYHQWGKCGINVFAKHTDLCSSNFSRRLLPASKEVISVLMDHELRIKFTGFRLDFSSTC